MNARHAHTVTTRLDIDPRREPAKTVERTKKPNSEASSDRGTSSCSSLDDDLDGSFQNMSQYLSDDDSDIEPVCGDSESVQSDSSLDVYLQHCEKHGITPYSSIQKGLDKGKLRCKYQQMDLFDVQAICCALSQSLTVVSIDFERNEIGPTGARLFSNVLSTMPYLTQVRLARNSLGPQGTQVMCEAVQDNPTITVLDLSGNGLDEGNGIHVQKLIEESDTLQELYLSENKLMQNGVEAIATGLTHTSTLRILDLKWNHIRLKGATAIGRAIRNNSSLQKLDVSWNGLYIDDAESLAVGLPKNDTLLELDISRNRLDETCLTSVLSGLKGNSALKRLRITDNHFNDKGAKIIVTELKKYKKSGLEFLDLGTLEVTDSFVEEYHELRQTRDIEIIHGMVWKENRAPLPPAYGESVVSALLKCDPLIVIMECIRMQSLRVIDFFRSLDKDRNGMLSLEEICSGLMQINVPVDKDTLRVFLKELGFDGNQEVDYLLLIQAHKRHRAMIRDYLQQDVDIEATEIGKVIALLTQVFEKNSQSGDNSPRKGTSKDSTSSIKDHV